MYTGKLWTYSARTVLKSMSAKLVLHVLASLYIYGGTSWKLSQRLFFVTGSKGKFCIRWTNTDSADIIYSSRSCTVGTTVMQKGIKVFSISDGPVSTYGLPERITRQQTVIPGTFVDDHDKHETRSDLGAEEETCGEVQLQVSSYKSFPFLLRHQTESIPTLCTESLNKLKLSISIHI